MYTDLLDALKTLLELGWPAIVTIAAYLIARQYMITVENEIAFLREQVLSLESEIISVKHDLMEANKKLNSR